LFVNSTTKLEKDLFFASIVFKKRTTSRQDRRDSLHAHTEECLSPLSFSFFLNALYIIVVVFLSHTQAQHCSDHHITQKRRLYSIHFVQEKANKGKKKKERKKERRKTNLHNELE